MEMRQATDYVEARPTAAARTGEPAGKSSSTFRPHARARAAEPFHSDASELQVDYNQKVVRDLRLIWGGRGLCHVCTSQQSHLKRRVFLRGPFFSHKPPNTH